MSVVQRGDVRYYLDEQGVLVRVGKIGQCRFRQGSALLRATGGSRLLLEAQAALRALNK
jgi:hypothetical protein